MCMFDTSEPIWAKDRKRLIAYKVLSPPGPHGWIHPHGPWRSTVYPIGEVVNMGRVADMKLLRTKPIVGRAAMDRGIFAFATERGARKYAATMFGDRVYKVNLSGRVVAYEERRGIHPAGYRAEQCRVIEEIPQ